MKGKELDKIDAEGILQMLKSPAYALVAGRIDAEVGRQNKELVEVQHTESEMQFHRGFILGLRKALEIPRIVASEASAPEVKPRSPRRR